MDRDLLFQALADAHRRELLDRLRRCNGQSLGALCADLPITRQAVTKHLRLLEAAGLVVTQKSGRERLHYLNPVPLHAEVLRWLTRFDQTPIGGLGMERG